MAEFLQSCESQNPDNPDSDNIKERANLVKLGRMLRDTFLHHRAGATGRSPLPASRDTVQRANRAAAANSAFSGPGQDNLSALTGQPGQGWARSEYGRYMATSPSVYAAVKLRADALTRPPLRVYRMDGASPSPSPQPSPVKGEGANRRVPVSPSHPVARLLDRVNPWHTRADLWRATETFLCLWDAAFWAIERGEDGEPELWPLRPDRMVVIPDRSARGGYVRGFVYRSPNSSPMEPVAYTPDEIVWLRYFNPLEELAGLSPLAPARLSADTGHEGLSFNRHLLRNSARPDFLLLTNQEMNEAELEEFYARWEMRYQGSGNAHRPAVASAVRDVKTLGLSHRDIDFIQGLRWSLEEVSRTYGVPKLLLGDFERATYANVQASERMFWRNTIVPEVRFLEEQLNRMLLPRLGYPNLGVEFDLSVIEALQEDENNRVQRETALLDRGVLTINEVRRERNLPEVPWGDGPASGQ